MVDYLGRGGRRTDDDTTALFVRHGTHLCHGERVVISICESAVLTEKILDLGGRGGGHFGLGGMRWCLIGLMLCG